LTEGVLLGATDGKKEGKKEGLVLGPTEGVTLGSVEGVVEGAAEGDSEGAAEGDSEGVAEGVTEGAAEGETDGEAVGLVVGDTVGLDVGLALGDAEGLAVGPLEVKSCSCRRPRLPLETVATASPLLTLDSDSMASWTAVLCSFNMEFTSSGSVASTMVSQLFVVCVLRQKETRSRSIMLCGLMLCHFAI
jgi:hypothetical protein